MSFLCIVIYNEFSVGFIKCIIIAYFPWFMFYFLLFASPFLSHSIDYTDRILERSVSRKAVLNNPEIGP